MEGMPDDSKSCRCWGERMKTQYRNQEIIDVRDDGRFFFLMQSSLTGRVTIPKGFIM